MNKNYKLLIDDLSSMSSKENFWYWMFPYLLVVTLMALYFLGTPFLAEIVAPKSNREYGLVENMQLVFLLGIVIISFSVLFNNHALLQKLGFIILGVLAIFVFLEEMDYGDHLIRYFTDGKQRSIFFNRFGKVSVHNKDVETQIFFRRIPYVIMFFLFIIFPFVNRKYFHPIFNYLVPMPRMSLMIILFTFAYLTPRLLVDYGIFEVGSLGVGNSIGEFTEMIIYYIFLIYTYHIVHDKKWPTFSGSE